MINVIDKYQEFQKCHDGQKMEMMEELLTIALNEIDPKVNESNTEDDLSETEKWNQLKEEKQVSKELNRDHEDWEQYKKKQELKAEKKLFEILHPDLS